MENNPKRKTDRKGKACRPNKPCKPGRKGKTNAGNKGETAYERLNKALAVHEKTLAKKPGDAGAWAGKAAVYLKHRMHKDSLKAIEKAIEIEPENPAYLYEKGFVLLQLNQEEAALQTF